MFRSLFVRMSLTYFLILMLGLLILGGFFYTFMTNYITDETYDELEREGRVLAGYFNWYYGRYITRGALQGYCALADKYQNTLIRAIALDREQNEALFEYTSSSSGVVWDSAMEINALSEEEMATLQSGEVVRRRGVYEGEEKFSMLTVCLPLYENKQVYGILFLHTPLTGVSQTLTEIFRFVLLSAAISAAVTIAIMFFYSRRITQPIVQMSQATRKIVKGDYSKRIEVKGRDEIGSSPRILTP